MVVAPGPVFCPRPTAAPYLGATGTPLETSLARKRKKSKSRKKRRKDAKSGGGASAVEESGTETEAKGAEEDAAIDDGGEAEAKGAQGEDEDAAAKEADEAGKKEVPKEAEEGESGKEQEEKSGKKTARETKSGGKRVDAVIDLDDDLDDPAARAQLIAAAAGDEDEAATDDVEPTTDEDDDTDLATEEAEAATDDVEPATEDVDPQRPLIGRDALLALSEFRAEGVATVPEELVLELGEATSPEDRDRLLAAALAHVEMQEAIYRVPTESGTPRRWKAVIAATFFVMALFLIGLPPSFLVPAPPPQLTTAERLRGVRVALLLQAQQIEAFHARTQRLPASLAEVPTSLPGIRFVRSNDRLYQLIAYTPDGEAIVYDSAAPDRAFESVAASWITIRGES